MSLLTEFLRILIKATPNVFELVTNTLKEMHQRGHFSEDRMNQLIREIRPARDKEIDQEINQQVAAAFPKDPEEKPA